MVNLKEHVTLWPHQIGILGEAEQKPKMLLEAGCGVGKTLTVLANIVAGGFRYSLIITLKTAMRSVWENEIREKTEGFNVLVLDRGTALDKEREVADAFASAAQPLIVIVNYETARRITWSQFPFDFVCADESHKLKSHNSAVSQVLAKECRHIPNKIAMTGTMYADRPTDIYGQMRFLNPELYRGRAYAADLGFWTAFFDQYVIYYQQDNIKIPRRYKNLDKLAKVLQPYIVQIKREDVLSLPPVRHQNIPLNMPATMRRVYNEMRDDLITYIENNPVVASNMLVRGMRLQQITSGFYRPEYSLDTQPIPGGQVKLDALKDLLESLLDEPFVVFTAFRDDIDRISQLFELEGVSYSILQGGQDEHRDWQQHKTQALICNLAAGSAGINLSRAAYGVYYSSDFSQTNYEQSIARLHRPGQTRPVLFYHLLVRDSMDTVIAAALSKKQDVGKTLTEALLTYR